MNPMIHTPGTAYISQTATGKRRRLNIIQPATTGRRRSTCLVKRIDLLTNRETQYYIENFRLGDWHELPPLNQQLDIENLSLEIEEAKEEGRAPKPFGTIADELLHDLQHMGWPRRFLHLEIDRAFDAGTLSELGTELQEQARATFHLRLKRKKAPALRYWEVLTTSTPST
jgi:hypothetical protein